MKRGSKAQVLRIGGGGGGSEGFHKVYAGLSTAFTIGPKLKPLFF